MLLVLNAEYKTWKPVNFLEGDFRKENAMKEIKPMRARIMRIKMTLKARLSESSEVLYWMAEKRIMSSILMAKTIKGKFHFVMVVRVLEMLVK